MSDNQELIKDFLLESYENLDRLDRDLVGLEKNPRDRETLSSIFRTIHTIKGTCGFLGFGKLESVAHVGESLLSRLREGELTLNAERTSGLLTMVDAVREILNSIETTEAEGDTDYSALVEALTQLNAGKEGVNGPWGSAPVAEAAEAPEPATVAANEPVPVPATDVAAIKPTPAVAKEPEGAKTAAVAASGNTVGKAPCSDLPPGAVVGGVGADDHDTNDAHGAAGAIAVASPAEVTDADLDAALAEALGTPLAGSPEVDMTAMSSSLAEVPPTKFPPPGKVEVDGVPVEGTRAVIGSPADADAEDEDEALLSADEHVELASVPPAPEAVPAAVTAAKPVPALPAAVAVAPMAAQAEPAKPTPVKAAPPAPVKAAAAPTNSTNATGANAAAAHPPGEGEAKAASVADAAIRVDVTLLDKLMNLVGELVLARNQILQHTASTQSSALSATTQRLNLITTELQEGVMKTRMQQIQIIWQKFPRVVRDLSTTCGKQIRLEMEGKETELDKTIIEAIKDPLTHIVRNSVDHGIESPEKRVAAGKPAEGTLKLRAFHEGGQVIIEISDDGGGINPERVKAKALEKGLITPEQAARFGEREAINLIFLPGFSTAEKISNISGRGVGMDVVKTNIEKIGGMVDISSRLGEGTTLRIKIPLTLAIIPALLITSGGERFAIPQVSLLELVRLDGEQARKQIEDIHGAPVYRLRGNLLPLANLNGHLKLPNPPADAPVNIVVLQADGRHFGLIVDQINDTEEIVVKPLGKQLKGISYFAGATIMGDGRVALILDVMGLAHAAQIVGEGQEQRMNGERPEDGKAAGDVNKQTMLLFRVGQRRRMAVPLAKVSRLEEFPLDMIESEGDMEVVQYRGRIMPLVRLSTMYPDPVGAGAVAGSPGSAKPDSAKTDENAMEEESNRRNAHVVVYSRNGITAGLIVDVILDIVEESLMVDRRKARHGVLGATVIQGKVTELLDVEGLVKELFDTSGLEAAAGGVAGGALEARAA